MQTQEPVTHHISIKNTKRNLNALHTLYEALNPDQDNTLAESYGFQPHLEGAFGIEFRLPGGENETIAITLIEPKTWQ